MFCLNKNVSQNKKEKVNESCLVHESLVSKQLILMNYLQLTRDGKHHFFYPNSTKRFGEFACRTSDRV